MDAQMKRLRRGRNYWRRGNLQRRWRSLMTYYKAMHTNIEAQVGRVAALLHMGEPQLALGACDKVLATQPTHLNALVLKCWVLMSLRRYDDVREILNQYLWNERDSALFWHVDGKLLILRQELDLVLDSLDMALGRDPDLCDAWIDKGNVLLRLGRPEDALLAFGRALALQPDNNEARKGRDRARAMQRHPICPIWPSGSLIC